MLKKKKETNILFKYISYSIKFQPIQISKKKKKHNLYKAKSSNNQWLLSNSVGKILKLKKKKSIGVQILYPQNGKKYKFNHQSWYASI